MMAGKQLKALAKNQQIKYSDAPPMEEWGEISEALSSEDEDAICVEI